MTMKNAPRPDGCCEGCAESCGRGGNWRRVARAATAVCSIGTRLGVWAQYPTGPYDCSPCSSCDWGCNGHQHPFGYKTGHECYCQNDGCNGQPNCVCPALWPRLLRRLAGAGLHCCPFCGCGPSGDQNYNFNPGPPVAQTAYPYYTLRGPRDFLLNNPPSIGPY